MALFQKSIISKHIKHLDNDKVSLAFEKFEKFYGDKERLRNIMQLKEENYQEGFLREIFVQILGYTINPDKNYNLTTEYKNQKNNRKADGAILKNGKAIAVIELKSTKTKDIESIKEQAFSYKNNQPDCRYVITSNFQRLRLYVDNATEYEEFDLFDLSKERFRIFYLLLTEENVLNDLPGKLKEETKFHDEEITAKLYNDYKQFKDKIFDNLLKQNSQYDKLTLFKKSQKLLDRFLFVLFAEDSGLIPPNAISKIIEQWKIFIENDEYFPLYNRFQKLFHHLDKGHVYKNWGEIPAYNGGLFREDEILDKPDLKIPDGLLQNHTTILSAYDFSSEVDVNILGHIFEHSLSEIEEITVELEGNKGLQPLVQSKRKKDGIFYTPKYITKYIVENTVGKLCEEKKTELQINNLLIDDNIFRKATTRGQPPLTKKGKQLFDSLNTYKDWLLTLKILDPACGSGAFLNQTLEFLIAEHRETDDKIAELTGDTTDGLTRRLRLFDTDKAILENNIFGVDINEESVEIAKLSLWLRTARRGRALSDLSNNIKCGNSLIDDPEVAGEKAFDWHTEFKEIMDNGGFDVVLGNPPYRIVFEENMKLFLEKVYPVFKRNNDLFVAFFERGLQLVKRERYFALITPNTYIRGDYFRSLRTMLSKNQILEIVDFGSKLVFSEANVFTAICCLKKTKSKSGWLMKSDLKIEKGYVKANTSDFLARNGLFLKLSKYKKIGDFFLVKDVGYNYWSKGRGKKRGSGSIGDRVFYSGVRKHLEDIPYLKGSQIKRYYNLEPVNFLISNYRIFLNENDTFRFTPEILETIPKIVYRQTSSKLIGSIDDQAFHTDKTVHSVIPKSSFKESFNLKFVLTLFNSKLLNYYYSILTEEAGRVFAQVKTVYVKDLPFFDADDKAQRPFIEKADVMLSLNKELQSKKDDFLNSLKDHKGLQKINKRLENFNELDFSELIKEIGKQKIRFTLGKETNEWRDYFNNSKQTINKLQSQINQTDKEIDKMVYELYKLTPEEIETVENSVRRLISK